MRILHTADWHLNARLNRVALQPYITASLEHIALLLEEYRVDVLLVAGDVFAAESSPEEVENAARDAGKIFESFLHRGGMMLVVAGEHDSDAAFEILSRVLRESEQIAPEQLYFSTTPTVVWLPERIQGGESRVVPFVLLPHPTPHRYLAADHRKFGSLREQHAALEHAFFQTLKTLRDSTKESQSPAVLVSHIAIKAAPVSESEEAIAFAPQEDLTNWAYAAYGHRHAPGEAVPGASHTRYAGSIARLSPSERSDSKSVVIFDLDARGEVGEFFVVPLPVATFYDVDIGDPDAEIPTLRARFPDAEGALVAYTLHPHSDTHDVRALLAELDRIFPHWYRRTLRDHAGALLPLSAPDVVRDYLKERFKDHPERDALLNLADELLAEEE